MRKSIIAFVTGISLLLIPTIAFATATTWDYNGTLLQPLVSQKNAQVNAANFFATSTTATSTFKKTNITGPGVTILGEYFTNFTTYVRSLFSNGTGLSYSGGAFSITNTGVSGTSCTNCNLSYNAQGQLTSASNGSASSGGSGSVSTSTADVSGQVTFFTSNSATPALIGGASALTYNSSASRLSFTYASSTGITAGKFFGALVGNSDTSTALAANGTNCSAGNYPLGVDASGNAESCTAAAVGTVTAVSVATANGFAGSSSGGATPALTISTNVTGVLKGNGTAISTASNGTDFTLITAKTCNVGDFVSSVTAAGVFTCTTPAGTTYTGTFPIQVTGSVISSLFSTTTNTGMAQGNLYVGSGGILQTTTSSTSIFGYLPLNPTRSLTVAGTANQITSSAGAQDLSADRTWTLSLPQALQFPLSFTSTYGTTTYASSTALTATNFASTNATSSNLTLTGAAVNCNGVNALITSSSGVVGCNAQPQGTVTAISVATANGFAGSSSGGATPALTLTTTVTGLLKGNGTAISTAALADFPTQSANTVIANGTGATAAPIALSTTSLFAALPGQVLTFNNGIWAGVATTTYSAPLVFVAGNVTCTSASSGVTGCLMGTDWNTFNGKQSALTFTYPLVNTGGVVTGFGTTTTWGLGSNGLVMTGATGIPFVQATSSAIALNISGNAATVTTNANLSGVVTSSGNVTSFGSQTAGVLGSVVTGNTGVLATSTLYGTGSPGQVLMWSGSAPVWAATSTTIAGGASTNFSYLSNFASVMAATSSKLWAQTGIYASSTSQIASTTFSINGNIGIGSSSPTSLLTLIQNNTSSLFTAFTIDGVMAGAGAEMALNRGSNTGTEEAVIDFNTNNAELWQLGMQDNSSNDFELWTGADRPVFTIQANTNRIGFGTTTPFGDFAIDAEYGDILPGNLILNIASSSLTSTTSVFSISNTGSTTLFQLNSSLLKTNAGGTIVGAIGDTDYQKPVTLTTTGSSGAATFTGDILNIPQYTGSSGAYPFTPSTDGGINVSATTSPLMASSSGLAIDIGTTGWYGIGGALFAYASTSNGDTIVGLQAGGQGATTTILGNNNGAFGFAALKSNTTGYSNNAFGSQTLISNTTGLQNAGLGVQTLQMNTTGSNNIAVGFAALNLNTTGTGNTGIGFFAGFSITTGYSNTIIGDNSTAGGTTITTGAGNIGIGTNIFFPSPTASNQLNIGNILFGTLPATSTKFSIPTAGTIGIGTSSPFAKLSVQANNGDTNQTLFAIGSSTATATTTLFRINNVGHIIASSTNPAVVCAGGTLTSFVGDDTHGEGVCGAGSTSMAFTFSMAWSVVPICVVSNQNVSLTSAFTYVITTTALTVTQSVGLSGDKIDFICEGLR